MPNGFYVLKQKYVHIHVHSTNWGAKIQIYEEPLGVVLILTTTHTLIEVKTIEELHSSIVKEGLISV